MSAIASRRRVASALVSLFALGAAIAAPAPAAAVGGWATTAPLTTTTSGGRVAFSDTLLSDGRVLLAGGYGNRRPPEEIYDPATDTWTRTGSLAMERFAHTATLINDGKVLVAGGQDLGSRPIASAEIYDPAAADPATGAKGSWRPTAPLIAHRQSHTATLISGPGCAPNCGKVLVTGGLSLGLLPLASAELYDPATGTWTQTGSLATARYRHRATPLKDGKVLVAGGSTLAGITASAELYDPATGSWTETDSMTVGRIFHDMARMANGKVLVAGGFDAASASAEIYDPETGNWTETAAMLAEASSPVARLLPSGRLFVTESGQPQLYDPAADSWSWGAPPDTSGTNFTALSDGKILMTAATTTEGLVGEVFDETGARAPPTVIAISPVSGPTSGGTPVTITGKGLANATSVSFGSSAVDPVRVSARELTTIAPPHAAGEVSVTVTHEGGVSAPGSHATFSYVSPRGGKFSPTNALTTARSRHTATRLPDGRVLVAGGKGSDGEPLASAELFDPGSGLWTATGSLATARHSHAASLLPTGRMLVVGGTPQGTAAEVYDPATGVWTPTGPLSIARPEGLTATLLSGAPEVCGSNCGRVLVVGSDETAEIYDPQQRSWRQIAVPGLIARELHTATLLQSGKVLVTGGQNAGPQQVSIRAGDSAELFDPANESWTVGEPLNAQHFEHTATLLEGAGCATRCGHVLAAGGGRPNSLFGTDSSELYDTGLRGRWSSTDALRMRRLRHSATLLPGGKVLVTGGLAGLFPDRDRLPLAELYDVEAGTWSYAHPMATPRESHSATLLSGPGCAPRCGRVLIAGGNGEDGKPLGSAELFTPTARVTGLAPANGPTAGGTKVTITGAGFDGGVSVVSFGDVAAGEPTVISDDKLTAITPPHAAGTVPVTVSGDGGSSDPSAVAQFTYEPAADGPDGSGGGFGSGSATTPGGGGAQRNPASVGGSTGPLAATEARRRRRLRSCLTRARRHTRRERRLARRRGSLPARALARRHLRRHGARLRRRCLARHGRPPGRVRVLRARALSGTQIELSFRAPGSDRGGPPPARAYLIKQSTRPIKSRRSFRRAQALCGGSCRFTTSRVGEQVRLTITGLRPKTTYYYAIAARDNVSRQLGPRSRTVRARTR